MFNETNTQTLNPSKLQHQAEPQTLNLNDMQPQTTLHPSHTPQPNELKTSLNICKMK